MAAYKPIPAPAPPDGEGAVGMKSDTARPGGRKKRLEILISSRCCFRTSFRIRAKISMHLPAGYFGPGSAGSGY